MLVKLYLRCHIKKQFYCVWNVYAANVHYVFYDVDVRCYGDDRHGDVYWWSSVGMSLCYPEIRKYFT